MGNIITGVFSAIKFFVENPIWSVLIVLGILLMPLDVFDLIIFVIVNIFVIFINLIIFILFMLFNAVVWIINSLIQAIFDAFSSLGISGNAPELDTLNFVAQDYVTVNLFAPNTNLLMIILNSLGKALPLW